RIAANKGDMVPWTAKLIPITLYNREMMKDILMTLTASLLKSKNFGNLWNASPSKMASQPGEKLLISSETAIPRSAFLNAPASFSPSPNIQTFLPSCCHSVILSNLAAGVWLNRSLAFEGNIMHKASARRSLSPDIKCRPYCSTFNSLMTSDNPVRQDCSRVKYPFKVPLILTYT